MRVMLDSSFLIDHLRGDPAAIERFGRLFEDGDEPLLNLVVVCEVGVGLLSRDERAFRSIITASEFIQAGPDAARDAGRWRREAKRRGGHLSLSDALIASEAHHSGAAVLTRDIRDFALTPVRIETY